MRRTSVLLIGGGAGLLVGLYLLFQAVQSTSSSAATSSRTVEPIAHHETTAPAAPSAPALPTPRAIPHAAPASARPADVRSPSVSASSAPGDNQPPPASRANTKNFQWGAPQMNAQTTAVEPLVKNCLQVATEAGHPPNGKAVMTYIVAQRGDKVVVEETSIDQDKTTVEGAELLECLHNTSRSMKFEGLPREAEALVVTRSVTVDHGKLTENKHVGFSYLR